MARTTLGDRLTALSKDGNLSQRDREFAASLLKSYLRKNTLSAGRRPWVDKLEARAAEAAKTPKGEAPIEFVTLREAILAAEGDGTWAFRFVTSIIEQVQRGVRVRWCSLGSIVVGTSHTGRIWWQASSTTRVMFPARPPL